jgi:glycosyltransferase involved in cell wall biosynthesis
VPLLEAPHVDFVGWAGRAQRDELLANASALLYPIELPETFGLVMVEAMACGTPVLATTCGAVPEIVRNGLTGFHAPDLAALVELVPAALALDRERIRDEAIARFDGARMVDAYEELYRRLAGGSRRERAWAAAE